MAQKIIYICDKCGENFEKEDSLRLAMHYEICESCMKKLEAHVQAFFADVDSPIPEKKEPEKVEEKPKKEPAEPEQPQRKRIDRDKACALKLAGWSNKAIAEELGANFGSINAGLYSHLDSYCNGERFGRQGDEEDEEAAE